MGQGREGTRAGAHRGAFSRVTGSRVTDLEVGSACGCVVRVTWQGGAGAHGAASEGLPRGLWDRARMGGGSSDGSKAPLPLSCAPTHPSFRRPQRKGTSACRVGVIGVPVVSPSSLTWKMAKLAFEGAVGWGVAVASPWSHSWMVTILRGGKCRWVRRAFFRWWKSPSVRVYLQGVGWVWWSARCSRQSAWRRTRGAPPTGGPCPALSGSAQIGRPR